MAKEELGEEGEQAELTCGEAARTMSFWLIQVSRMLLIWHHHP